MFWVTGPIKSRIFSKQFNSYSQNICNTRRCNLPKHTFFATCNYLSRQFYFKTLGRHFITRLRTRASIFQSINKDFWLVCCSCFLSLLLSRGLLHEMTVRSIIIQDEMEKVPIHVSNHNMVKWKLLLSQPEWKITKG